MVLNMAGLADEDGIEDADLGEERVEFKNPGPGRVYLNGELVSPAELQKGDRLSISRDADGNVRRINALRGADFAESADGVPVPARPDRDPRRRNPVDEEADPDERTLATRPDVLGQRFSAEEREEYLDGIPDASEKGDGEGGFADVTVEKRGGESDPQMRNQSPQSPASDGPSGFQGGGESYGMGMLISDNPGPGVMVADVAPDGPAEQAGVQQGDFLMAVNGKEITTPEELEQAAKQAPQDKPVTFSVWRDGATEAVEVTPEQGARNEVSPVQPSGDEPLAAFRVLGEIGREGSR